MTEDDEEKLVVIEKFSKDSSLSLRVGRIREMMIEKLVKSSSSRTREGLEGLHCSPEAFLKNSGLNAKMGG